MQTHRINHHKQSQLKLETLDPEAAVIHANTVGFGDCGVNAAWMALPCGPCPLGKWRAEEPWDLQQTLSLSPSFTLALLLSLFLCVPVCLHVCTHVCMYGAQYKQWETLLELSPFQKYTPAHLAEPERCEPTVACFMK